MIKEIKSKYFILQWTSNLKFKDFNLGLNICSDEMETCREFYILLSFGFWQLGIGFRINNKYPKNKYNPWF
jgi:hypothetical protein